MTQGEELYEVLKARDSEDYEPALKAVHSRSRGIVQRILSAVTNREHHLLSRNERGVFLIAEFDRFVTNIREQFAIPLPLTMALAETMNIRHPGTGGELHPVTTDFVFTIEEKEGRRTWAAVDFKLKKDLTPRAREKIRLAAASFAQVGVTHYTVTEDDIPYVLIQNLRWLHIHRLGVDGAPFDPMVLEVIEPQLRDELIDGKTVVFEAARSVADFQSLPTAQVARACYWLIANAWSVDITKPIGPDYPVSFDQEDKK